MPELTFPQGFLWGSATSSHQVEGNNVNNDWWAWEQAGRVAESSGRACEHYQRYEADFELSRELGHNAHRFSIEWSRVEPEAGVFDQEVLEHYRQVVRALRARGLEPVVTLHHFTSPRWLAEKGGWVLPKAVDYFQRYTQHVAQALRGSVRYWLTINEPMVYVNMHYLEGIGPPGARDSKQALRVTEHLIRAHAAAYRVLHETAASEARPVAVSVAKHLPVFMACRRWWPGDRWARFMTDRIFNAAFLEVLTTGHWSVPGVATWSIPEARGTLDYLGVNYYARQFIRWDLRAGRLTGLTCDPGHHLQREVQERSGMGWDVYPEALTETLLRAARLKLPILITENGTWMEDDARRWRFIARHLAAMEQALQRGARIIGYLYWSLMDNFEWAQGFTPRFGLVEVDYPTQARRPRMSAKRFAEVCTTNRLRLDEGRAP